MIDIIKNATVKRKFFEKNTMKILSILSFSSEKLAVL